MSVRGLPPAPRARLWPEAPSAWSSGRSSTPGQDSGSDPATRGTDPGAAEASGELGPPPGAPRVNPMQTERTSPPLSRELIGKLRAGSGASTRRPAGTAKASVSSVQHAYRARSLRSAWVGQERPRRSRTAGAGRAHFVRSTAAPPLGGSRVGRKIVSHFYFRILYLLPLLRLPLGAAYVGYGYAIRW